MAEKMPDWMVQEMRRVIAVAAELDILKSEAARYVRLALPRLGENPSGAAVLQSCREMWIREGKPGQNPIT